VFAGGVSVAVAVSLHRDELIPTYQTAAEAASTAGKLDESLLYYRKLKSLNGGAQETRFDYAMDLSRKARKTIESGRELRKTDEEAGVKQIRYGQSLMADAETTIAEIAPLDDQGLPAAHLYLARRMLSSPKQYLVNKEGKLNSDGVKALEHHLLAAEKGMENSIELQMAFFYYYLGMNQFREATEYLEKVATKRPHLRYELTNLYFRMGDRKNALRNLNLASDYYEKMVRENPNNHEMRARCATIRLNKRDLKGCIQMLEYGHAREKSEDSPYPQLLAQTHVAVYDVLSREPNIPLEQRLAHLRAALSYVTDYQPALVRIIQFVTQPGDAGREVEAYLQKMIAEGRMPATGHFALGTKAWQDKDIDKALWHLERAFELDPGLGHIGNNLAWILAEKDPPDLERALQIISSVVDEFPDVPTFRDTKGQIHVKRGEWKQGLVDLEAALPFMKDNLELHQSLAKIYEQLGKPELASEHSRIAADLETQQKIKEQKNPVFNFQPGIPELPAKEQ